MKKILAYTLAAVLLGALTMLAPFINEMDENDTNAPGETSFLSPTDTRARSSETEKSLGIAAAQSLPDFLFTAFMLGLSFATAFGIMRYSKRKAVF